MFWDNAFAGNPFLDTLETWDNKPGGTVVDRTTIDGVKYVYVEFENTPGKRYLYIA